MNNEFKKIKTQNETRYILETASTVTTGAVATAPSNLGALRRRLEELKAKLSVPRAKPRNPVGMGSTQGRGTQKHQPNQRQTARDEKKIQGVAEGKFVKADGGVPSDRHAWAMWPTSSRQAAFSPMPGNTTCSEREDDPTHCDRSGRRHRTRCHP